MPDDMIPGGWIIISTLVQTLHIRTNPHRALSRHLHPLLNIVGLFSFFVNVAFLPTPLVILISQAY